MALSENFSHLVYTADNTDDSEAIESMLLHACVSKLRPVDSKYRELIFKTQITDFLIFYQEKPFGQLFSKITLKLAREFLVLRNPTKSRIAVLTLRPP